MKEKDLEGIRFGLFIQIGKDTTFDNDTGFDGETLEDMGYSDMEDHYILYNLDEFGEWENLHYGLNDYLENEFGDWCVLSYDYTIHPIIEGEIYTETMNDLDEIICGSDGDFEKGDITNDPVWKTILRNKKLEVLGL